MEKVNVWRRELETLAEIAETEPQAAYAAYTKGYKSKFTFFLRTIEDFEEYLEPIDSVLFDKLTPNLFGGSEPDVPKELLALNPNDGGIGIERPGTMANQQFKASVLKTKIHVESILDQYTVMREKDIEGNTTKEIEAAYKASKSQTKKQKMEKADKKTPESMKNFVSQAKDKGASSWLNALPIQEQHLNLNKEQFSDAMRLRYNIPLSGIPSYCACGNAFNVTHALDCKKGGFVHQRHDNLRDLLTHLLSKVCKDVEVEPHLLPITTEVMNLRTANTSEEARLDIKAKGFWQRSQTAFFDIRVTHVNSSSQRTKPTSAIFRNHEAAKKREYLQRVLQVEQGVSTPLVFGNNGVMGI